MYVVFFRWLVNIWSIHGGDIFFVSHGQISEIISDEPWMDSEINCLCNVAFGRKIWLILGSKRKSANPMEINVGDWVTVSNCGNLFPWAQVKEIGLLQKPCQSKMGDFMYHWCCWDLKSASVFHKRYFKVKENWDRLLSSS